MVWGVPNIAPKITASAQNWLNALARANAVANDAPIVITPEDINRYPANPAPEPSPPPIGPNEDAIKEEERRRREIAEQRRREAEEFQREQDEARKMRGWPEPEPDALVRSAVVVRGPEWAGQFTQSGVDAAKSADTLAALQMRSNVLQKLLGISPNSGLLPAERLALEQIAAGQWDVRKTIGFYSSPRETGTAGNVVKQQAMLYSDLYRLDQQEKAVRASALKRAMNAGLRDYISRLLGL